MANSLLMGGATRRGNAPSPTVMLKNARADGRFPQAGSGAKPTGPSDLHGEPTLPALPASADRRPLRAPGWRLMHGPSPIQAESKFSQAGPSRHKDNPRKRLGFPWISLSVWSLSKDLRGPPGPEISSAPSPRSKALNSNGICRVRARPSCPGLSHGCPARFVLE